MVNSPIARGFDGSLMLSWPSKVGIDDQLEGVRAFDEGCRGTVQGESLLFP